MRMKNPKFAQLALEVGGSHYPGVGGELLEKFAEALIKECQVALHTPLRDMISRGQAYELIRAHFDLDKDGLQEFEIQTTVPAGFAFNGSVPFDMEIVGNQAFVTVRATSIEDAVARANAYFDSGKNES